MIKIPRQGFLMVKILLMYFFFLILVIVLGWVSTQQFAYYARREIIQEGEASLFALVKSVDQLMQETDKVAKIYAGSPGVILALTSDDPEDQHKTNFVLDRYARNMAPAVFYVLDKEGTTVATSNRNDPDSFLGKNYQFRPYFQQALKGMPGRHYAKGVTSGKRGYFASAPVFDEDQNLLGVAVIKKEIDDLEQAFQKFNYAFLLNPHSIVFLSSKPIFALKSLWGITQDASDELIESRSLGKGPFLSLGLDQKKSSEDMAFEKKKFIFQQEPIDMEGWSVVLFSPAGRVRVYVLFGVLATVFLCFVLTALIVFFYIINQNAQSARVLAAIVQSSGDAIIGLSNDGKIKSWNKGAEKIYGYSTKEAMGQSIGIVSFDQDQEAETLLTWIKSGKSMDGLQTTHMRKNGKTIETALTISPVFDHRNKFVGSSMISRDVSQEKQIEERTRKVHMELLSIFDNIDEIIYISDPETYELIYFNNAFKKNWPARIGDKCHKIIHGLDKSCFFCTNEKIFGENLGKTFAWEKYNELSKRWYRLIDKSIPWPNGKHVRYEMAIDVTEAKKIQDALASSEQRLKAFIQNLPGAVYRCYKDQHWTMKFFSPYIEVISGYPSLDFIDNQVRTFAGIIHPDDIQKVDQEIHKALQTKSTYHIEYRIIHKSGKAKWVLEKGQGVFDQEERLEFLDGVIFDITENKEAQNLIKSSKEYLDLIFSLTPSAIFTTDQNKIITKWNRKSEELTGFSAQEAIGQECLFFADQPCREKCGLYSDDIEKPISNKECTIRRKDGKIRTISKSADILKDQDGNIIGGIESFEDVTKQKEAVQALADSEEKYRHLVENANSFILRIDHQGKIRFFNEYAEKFFGFSQEEVVGKHVLETIVPSQDSRGLEMTEVIRKIIEDPGNHEINENENICKDGKRVWVRWANKVIYNEKTDQAEILSVGTDVTENKRFQEELIKLSRAVEQSPSTVVITDPDGAIEYVNPKFCQLTGYAVQEAIGQNPRLLKSGCQSDEFYKDLWETITRGEEWRGEFCNKKKNGDVYWESASISPIRDDQGKIVRFVAVKEDITAKKEAEERAQEAMRLKSEFISVVSHELRTPLTAIKEGISIVADGITGEVTAEQSEFLSVARRNVDRLARLINDVLDFQKLDVQQMDFDFVHQDIKPVVLEVVAMMQKVAESEKTEMFTDFQDNLPWVSFDRDRITQVITNLVSNAIKFASGKPVTIQASQENNTLRISIKDQGEGIKEEDFSKLFQTFSQLKKGKERKTGSTGLGLAICKKIVQEHGGKIWVESQLSQGSTFSFVLPLEERRGRQV